MVFQPPSLAGFGPRSTMAYWGLVVLCMLAIALYLALLVDRREAGDQERPERRSRWPLQVIAIGLLALLAGGVPFWIAKLPVGLTFPTSRFTVALMLGASLVLGGLIELIPARRLFKAGLLGLLIGLAIGVQYQNATSFRRDWNAQRTFFWQLAWRAPGLQPGTTILSADTPFDYESDNSLTSPLNWMYAPGSRLQQLSYMFYFISVRLQDGVLELVEGSPIHNDYLAAVFDGNTSQAVVMSYAPPGCLRLLDPVYDVGMPLMPELVQEALPLSKPGLVDAAPAAPALPPGRLFDPEPAHGWCYYFEKADLARQQGSWQEVARLGDIAFHLDDHPNDASERLPFIEGYAHVGAWDKAEEQTRVSIQITPLMKTMLCNAWGRIAEDTPATPEQQRTVGAMKGELGCGKSP